ncbi:MAG: hypothetical protein JW779_07960 [Candidatus Thorarchaeota archaeon]|nr:hypothetical protein [Candidatus Thorarchaeota archaeon]
MNKRDAPWYREVRLSSGMILRRVFVLFLIIDLMGMVYVTRYVFGNLEDGFEWGSPGHVLFPFPYEWQTMVPVTQPLNPLETFTYVLFIANGLWLLWVTIGLLYIFSPYIEKFRKRNV